MGQIPRSIERISSKYYYFMTAAYIGCLHTHTHTQPFHGSLDLARDYPGE